MSSLNHPQPQAIESRKAWSNAASCLKHAHRMSHMCASTLSHFCSELLLHFWLGRQAAGSCCKRRLRRCADWAWRMCSQEPVPGSKGHFGTRPLNHSIHRPPLLNLNLKTHLAIGNWQGTWARPPYFHRPSSPGAARPACFQHHPCSRQRSRAEDPLGFLVSGPAFWCPAARWMYTEPAPKGREKRSMFASPRNHVFQSSHGLCSRRPTRRDHHKSERRSRTVLYVSATLQLVPWSKTVSLRECDKSGASAPKQVGTGGRRAGVGTQCAAYTLCMKSRAALYNLSWGGLCTFSTFVTACLSKPPAHSEWQVPRIMFCMRPPSRVTSRNCRAASLIPPLHDQLAACLPPHPQSHHLSSQKAACKQGFWWEVPCWAEGRRVKPHHPNLVQLLLLLQLLHSFQQLEGWICDGAVPPIDCDSSFTCIALLHSSWTMHHMRGDLPANHQSQRCSTAWPAPIYNHCAVLCRWHLCASICLVLFPGVTLLSCTNLLNSIAALH